jgi:hypothetical protein
VVTYAMEVVVVEEEVVNVLELDQMYILVKMEHV